MAAREEFSFKPFAEQPFYRKVNQVLVDRAELQKGWTVVDVACGTGAVTELILEKIQGAREAVVIGLDMSSTALQQARGKLANARSAVVEFVQIRAEEMSCAVRRAADAVIFCNGIHYIEDKAKLLEEVRRTLRPGGVFAFNTAFFEGAQVPNTEPFYRRWMMKALRRLKKRYGLRPVKEKVQARRQLTADEYRELIESHGFEIRQQELVEVPVDEQGWVDISCFADFVAGTLPGVPVKTASEVLCESLRETFADLDLEVVPRNWLSVVAART